MEYFAGVYRFVRFLHKLSVYIFELPIPSASCRYATFISAMDYSLLGLAVILREFPLTALCAVTGIGLFCGSVPVCVRFAQTQSLNI